MIQNSMTVFNNNFLDTNPKIIVDEVKRKGYFTIDEGISEVFINNINSDVAKSGLNINNNEISGVYYLPGNQFFLTHMLAASKNFFDFCTSNKLIEICSNYFNSQFRLKAFRYYENFGGQKMQWHTDNKAVSNTQDLAQKNTKVSGLIFIVYLNDVNDGEFQYIEGSHLWSSKNQFNDYTEKYIMDNFRDKIVSFKKKKGSVIIYNTFGIHRAKPTKNKKFVRKSLFIQIDEDINSSTPIYINTEFFDKLDDKLKIYLGFGKKADQKIYPSANIHTMPLNSKILIVLIDWIFKKIKNNLISILPGYLRKKIRK